MDNLPFNQNINIAQAVSLLATVLVLATGGKINLSPADQAIIVGAINAGAALYTVIVHTFFNHPANQAKAAALVKKAVAAAKNTAPMMLACLLTASVALGGCSTLNSIIPQTPQTILNEISSGVALAEAAYDGICATGSAPSFCTDPDAVAKYNAAKEAILAIIRTAQAAINASDGVDTAEVQADLLTLQDDWKAFNDVVNTIKAKDAALRGVRFVPIPLHNR